MLAAMTVTIPPSTLVTLLPSPRREAAATGEAKVTGEAPRGACGDVAYAHGRAKRRGAA